MCAISARQEPESLSGSLERGLKILRALADADGLSVSAIAASQGVHRTTAFRVLQRLEAEGFVARDGGLWSLGPTLVQIGARALGQLSLREEARPVMQRLAETSGESVQLTIRAGDDMMAVDAVESPQAVRVGLPLGNRAPLYCTATGKAILAHLPGDEVDEYLDRVRFEPRTRHTVLDKAVFRRQLAEVAAQGYAVNDEESIEGVVFVAAPVLETRGLPVAVLVLGAPAMRLRREDFARHGAMVRQAAAQISHALRSGRTARDEVQPGALTHG